MRRWRVLAGRTIVAAGATWVTAAVCQGLATDRSVASLALVLEVLLFATYGDWLLAVIVSGLATLAFSWYFVDSLGSLMISSSEGAVSFSMMLCTALVGSRLAIRAQQRAGEAIRRREEMERLQQLGEALIATTSIPEGARKIVKEVVDLFDVQGARLWVEGYPEGFAAGDVEQARSAVPLRAGASGRRLELCGAHVSDEVRNALGNLINLVLDRARDCEARARVEAAQRGEQLRTTVLNALAHNFKTPLTSIKAASSVLRGSRSLSPEGREMAVVIDEEADRLSILIRDSLNLAKLESHCESPRRELCSLSDIVQSIGSRAQRYMGRRNLSVDVPEDLPAVWGDPFLLEQMLSQVVDNAWKYSGAGADIRIIGAKRGEEVVLGVQNEGGRIPEEERERIFDKFYRGAGSGSQVEGTGLGLAIARTIVEAHGGRIWLDSEPDGPAFRFSLPAGEARGAYDREPHNITH